MRFKETNYNKTYYAYENKTNYPNAFVHPADPFNAQCSIVNVQSDAWYTITGVKLNGVPTSKGVFINNGRKVVIK